MSKEMRKLIDDFKTFNNEKLNERLIDWTKIENYWNNLSNIDKKEILLKDDFADADYYKEYDFNSLPSDVQNNLLKFLPKFEKYET